jgi:hypothetical protein
VPGGSALKAAIAMNRDPGAASSPRLRVVELASAGTDVDVDLGPVVAVGSAADIATTHAQPWLERATFTLTQDSVDDRRVVTVPSVAASTEELVQRVDRWPQAAAICDDVLRSLHRGTPTWSGLVTESLAYSTLQSGREFRDWLARRGPASSPSTPDSVLVERQGDSLSIWLNRPARHNAFSTGMRQALLEALTIAQLDTSVHQVVLAGKGPSFCSGRTVGAVGRRTAGACARSSARQRTGDGRVLRTSGGGPGVPIRPARTGPRLDPRSGRHSQHHPANRPLAPRLSGAVRAHHNHRNRTAMGFDRRRRVTLFNSVTTIRA